MAPSGPMLLLSILKTLRSYLFLRHSESPSEPLDVIEFESRKSMCNLTWVLRASPKTSMPASVILFSPKSTVYMYKF